MIMGIYNKLMNLLTSIIFPNASGVNILELEWDHLIILDACRCDIFEKVYRHFFPENASFRCIESTASSTMEFIRKNILESPEVLKKLKNVVFVNANPVIDHVLGDRIHRIFYRYIPVWRKYWNEDLGTVEPKHTYMVALKTLLKYSDKRMIIWFLQPHYPYIDKRFRHINALGREFMNKAIRSNQDKNLATLMKIIATLTRRGYLCAGIPDNICEYMHQARSEAMKAYTCNLIIALQHIKKLAEILLGRIAVTSDHGEAFGEPLSELFPLNVYGHPSRTKILPLIQVPYLTIENNISRCVAIRKALREVVFLRSTSNIKRRHQ